MPKLDEIIAERKKGKFKKKDYRPWDLAGNSTEPEVKTNTTTRQTDNNSDNKGITTRKQPGNNQVTIGYQSDNNQITNRYQPDNITDQQTDNETGDKRYLIETIKKLTGIQKNIFGYVLNISLTRDKLSTDNILTKELAEEIMASYGSVKTSVKRLIDKGVLVRNKGKACRCGHINLGITKDIRTAAFEAYKNNYKPFSGNVTGNKTGNAQAYSSNNIYNNTTTNDDELPPEWLEINLEPLKHLGFSLTQLRQLYEKKLNAPEVIQESINHFAFGLENNEKIKGYQSPLNVLMGVLRKGNAWIEQNYESPQDRALREMVEREEKLQAKRNEYIRKMKEIEFEKWINFMTNEELTAIAPTAVKEGRDHLSGMSRGALYLAFDEAVWSKKREEISKMLGEEI